MKQRAACCGDKWTVKEADLSFEKDASRKAPDSLNMFLFYDLQLFILERFVYTIQQSIFKVIRDLSPHREIISNDNHW